MLQNNLVNSITFNGSDDSDFVGTVVAKSGDTDGDGIDDFIIGAPVAQDMPGAESRRQSYMIYVNDTIYADNLEASGP